MPLVARIGVEADAAIPGQLNGSGHEIGLQVAAALGAEGDGAEVLAELRARDAVSMIKALDGNGGETWEDLDHRVSDTMQAYWINFAKTGDPNGDGLPRWPVYRTAEDVALEIDVDPQTVAGLRKEKLDAYDALIGF